MVPSTVSTMFDEMEKDINTSNRLEFWHRRPADSVDENFDENDGE